MSHYSNTLLDSWGLKRDVAIFWAGKFWAGHLRRVDIASSVEVVFDCEQFTMSLIKVVKMFVESCRINIRV